MQKLNFDRQADKQSGTARVKIHRLLSTITPEFMKKKRRELIARKTIKNLSTEQKEERWLAPLQETFEPYKDKVEIINKFVSDVDSDSSVRLDHFIEENGAEHPFVLKLDIEGNEWTVLDSIRDVLSSGKYKFKITCCTYHKAEDAEKFKAFFDELGYKTRFTDRYMFMTNKDFTDVPVFRKGVIYATNM